MSLEFRPVFITAAGESRCEVFRPPPPIRARIRRPALTVSSRRPGGIRLGGRNIGELAGGVKSAEAAVISDDLVDRL
jgi:hypothetical protein